MTVKATAMLFVVGVIWGSSYLLIRVAVEEVSPLQLVLFRSVGGAAALLLLAAVQRRNLRLNRRHLTVAMGLAVVGSLVPFILIAWAETHIESGPAAVLNATMPLFVIAFATALLPEERLTFERAAGVVVGLIGVVVLVGSDVRDIASSSTLAQLAVLAASAFYALSAIWSRLGLRDWDGVSMSTVQIPLVALLSAPLALATETPRFDLSAEAWLSLLALGVMSTGVAYICYYWLISNVGSVRASLVTYIIPAVGVMAGALVLGESVRWNTFVGGAIILVSVGIVNGGVRQVRSWRRPTVTSQRKLPTSPDPTSH